jgi:uncharacterized protein (DUF2267 family)
MSNTGYKAFSTTVDKTNHVLREIEEAYGWPKERREQSYDALRAVLHTMRDRLTVNEAADFAAELPMLIRGLYYEGWRPAKVPVRMHRQEFFDRVKQEFPWQIEDDMEGLTVTVLDALREYISEGELEDVIANMPKDLAEALH